MTNPSDIWPPAVSAFPDSIETPQVIGVTDQEGNQVVPPVEAQGDATNKTMEFLLRLGNVRVIVRSGDETATLVLSNGNVHTRAKIVQP